MKVDDPTPHKHSRLTMARLLADLRETVERIHAVFADVPVLGDTLAICVDCKSVRDQGGDWQPITTYISERTETFFSHGLCPVCVDKYKNFSKE